MSAETVAKALAGRKTGSKWMARCLVEPSLSITEAKGGKVLVRFPAGCDQARVIATLERRGFWTENAPRPLSRLLSRASTDGQSDLTNRTEAALAIWQSGMPADGTVETNLASGRIHLPPPNALRFHLGLKHLSDGIWPAMVALVTRGSDDTPLGSHRTFFIPDRAGKAPIDPTRMMLAAHDAKSAQKVSQRGNRASGVHGRLRRPVR